LGVSGDALHAARSRQAAQPARVRARERRDGGARGAPQPRTRGRRACDRSGTWASLCARARAAALASSPGPAPPAPGGASSACCANGGASSACCANGDTGGRPHVCAAAAGAAAAAAPRAASAATAAAAAALASLLALGVSWLGVCIGENLRGARASISVHC